MKKLFLAMLVATCAFGAQADGDWKTTLGKVTVLVAQTDKVATGDVLAVIG